ncbi:extracellular solute-binding protein [Legionella geestiana]|uniref:Extracellular solute-binding protein n=1 Tax=Legionella geestiana TaxID=45065 RepID=A0A0W0UA74_9GAMM|nr:ABC transporter substrate-binding protein [Legionella geestiana]KTD04866.1 extracellular solute-binding protein [Legionella geestiana]QBS11308.1 peptide ABC transporter substrate-binding protein [Legionella geestiana]STX54054.1 extracellular solute-binding protein [Legionella geestiana]
MSRGILLLLLWSALLNASPFVLNNPWPDEERGKNIYYSSFSEQPKTLDPAKSYSSTEYQFLTQIYEPPLQYDYLARPLTLVPLTAKEMPKVRYLDARLKPSTKAHAAFSVYTIRIKPGIFYQPHPAFARDKSGKLRYHHISVQWLEDHDINRLADFRYTGTRELVADDYIYNIKRLASPWVNSSIYGLMSAYIVGFADYKKAFPNVEAAKGWTDLRDIPLAGVKRVDDYTFEIMIHGDYPQFMYWLAMPFFSPLPWEAEHFSAQPGMDDKNLVLGWYPVGTGPFMLVENNPNRQMVLEKNPNFREERFPVNGTEEDRKMGYLQNAGKRLPLIDKAVYALEKESLPRWNKFLQGYYDLSGISADSFANAVQILPNGVARPTKALRDKGIRLNQSDEVAIYYLGFNMLDPVVGGNSERARALRQAISIAISWEENIAIFFNGRGVPAQGPLPPGIFGYKDGREGTNPYVYAFKDGKRSRLPLARAHALMKTAGYPDGIDPHTGKPLILHYDVPVTGSPDDKAQLDWMRKQFARIGIDLNIRGTLYNRFQEKMRAGNAQIFSWGWYADYPDPENFLFMLYGPNGKVKHGGENAANYDNPAFNTLFDAMKNRENDAVRAKMVDALVEIVRRDAPWVWGINTQAFSLAQPWVSPMKPNPIAQNTLKYLAVDAKKREVLRERWNTPRLFSLFFMLIVLGLLLVPLVFAYYKRERATARRRP